MPRGKGDQARRFNNSSGFTLFEMVVVICSIVILYMVAERRLNELPAAAERANFYAILEQVRTGMNFEMIKHLANRDYDAINSLEGSNPMLLLLDTPRNYRGELDEVTDRNATRRSWYFESSTGELVYVVGGPSIEDVWVTIGGIPVNLGQLRFRIESVLTTESSANGSAGAAAGSSWQGLRLRPVRPFEWERRSETPVEL